MFENRKLLIATKHRKEEVIVPVLEQELGVQCFTDTSFDTDTLGTFTGEIERTLDPLSTVREKCLRAMEVAGCDLAVASEGSFGPHPSLFFVPADDELLIFIDQKNKLEIIVRELSTSTNFDGQVITSEKELLEFAARVQFPTHALILRPAKESFTDIHKGIHHRDVLLSVYEQLQATHGTVYAETDMRAMHNPTRMNVIRAAAEKLAAKIKSTCPECQTPGFGITDARKGLPCSWCGSPTNSILSYVYECQRCQYKQEELYPHQKQQENPMYCDRCNP